MKILSIDGGGVKGLYSAAFLAALEGRFRKSIADCFDLVAGTSTGGILALAIAARMPTQAIVDFYRQWGPKIFHPKLKATYVLRSLLFSRYPDKELKNALQTVFGDRKIIDIYNQEKSISCCIPSIDAIQGTPTVFKTPHDNKLSRDNDYYLWEVALATSAAPVYFPVARIRVPNSSSWKLYVDGGLWANNPSHVALVEALTYKKQSLKDIYLLSLGNIVGTTSFGSDTYLSKGIALWRTDVIGMTLDTQSTAVHNQIRLLFDSQDLSDHYTRIEHSPNEKQSSLKKLDCAKPANINDLEVLGRARADSESVHDNIMNFFT